METYKGGDLQVGLPSENKKGALFSNFGLTRVWRMDQNREFLNRILL